MRRRARGLGLVIIVLGLGVLSMPGAWAGSETPPEGPPWVRDLAEAQRQALEREVPIFVYLTKTYCPHCVKLENEVLCKAELEPIYAKAVWLYVYRDFTESDADRAAERVALRLGFSSYPQHHLLHPLTLARIATPSRSTEGFTQAFGSASVGAIDTIEGSGSLAAAEERAKRLEAKGRVADAIEALDNDDDIVVRFRAVEVLAAKKPAEIVDRAADLLKTPNDLLRYEVLKVIQARGDAASARVLDAIVVNPEHSLNPNVLRIRAVEALGACGDEASVAVIAPFARGPWNNGLTKTSVTAIRAIGQRVKAARAAARAALVAAYPAPPAAGGTDRAKRATVALAKHVHDALIQLVGRKRPFPDDYDEAARTKLMAAW